MNAFVEYFRTLIQILTSDWRGGLEIAVLAILLYIIFEFFHSARGAAVLRGVFFAMLAVLAIFFVLASAFELDRLIWVLEFLLLLYSIGVLAIFQPEIRRALVRSSGNRFVNLFVQRRRHLFDEIIQAIAFLSRENRGALIAIERSSTLWSYIRSGIRLDARLSAEVITSLFAPQASTADGALIIRDGKLAAAGSLLPPTETHELASSLGMRHRAAIGLTEATDAVAIVTSSVDGTIALAVRGELMQNISIEQMSETLMRLCDDVLIEQSRE